MRLTAPLYIEDFCLRPVDCDMQDRYKAYKDGEAMQVEVNFDINEKGKPCNVYVSPFKIEKQVVQVCEICGGRYIPAFKQFTGKVKRVAIEKVLDTYFIKFII